jgi:hypothetical protein
MFAALNCFCISAIFNLCSSTVPNQCVGGRSLNQASAAISHSAPLISWRDGGIVLNDSNVWAKLTQCPPNPRNITVNIQGKDVKRQEDAMLARNERRRLYGKQLLAYNQMFLSDMRHKYLLQRSDIGFVAIEAEAKRIAASNDDDLRDGQGEGRASHFRAKKRLHPGAVAGRQRHRRAGIGDVAGLAWQILLKKQRTFRHHLPIVGVTRAIKINSASKNGNLSFAVFPVPIVSSLW